MLRKVFSNLRHNLMVGHLVGCLNTDDAPAEVLAFESFLQPDFCYAGTRDQN